MAFETPGLGLEPIDIPDIQVDLIDRDSPLGRMLSERFSLQEALYVANEAKDEAERMHNGFINEIIRLNQEIEACIAAGSDPKLLRALEILRYECKGELILIEEFEETLDKVTQQYADIIRYVRLNNTTLNSDRADTKFFSAFVQGPYDENTILKQLEDPHVEQDVSVDTSISLAA